MSKLFASRWVERPGHVADAAGLAAGFRAAGLACGIKPSGKADLGLLVSDSPETVSAARFTRSGAAAAPVLVCKDRCRLDGLRAIVANSGCANAGTGAAGIAAALRTQDVAAATLGLAPEEIAVASTGGISHELPLEKLLGGLDAAVAALDGGGDVALSEAICTTDAYVKRASLAVELPSGPVRLSAQAKGAGMISPNFATMFCFVQTDAGLAPETAELLLGVCVKRSFDRISVDGQLSTNDIAVLMASGAGGVQVRPESPDELALGEALDAVLRGLALLIVADGEGARRVGRVVVSGGQNEAVERVARAVGNSPLVKTALFGSDPNWGRIAQAVGAALPDTAPLQFDLDIEGIAVCRAGAAVAYDEARLAAAVEGSEVEFEIGLPGAGAETELFFSDLSYDYVKINAEYTT